MIPPSFVVAALLLALASLGSVAGAVGATVVAGFLQDPLRKFVPGQPAIFVALSLTVFSVAAARWVLPGISTTFSRRNRLGPIGQPVALFLAVLFVLTARYILEDGSLIVVTLGVLSYVGPLVAMAAGYRLGRTYASAARVLRLYALIGLIAAATVAIEWSGVRQQWLGAVGEGLSVYGGGLRIALPSGFLRAPEVAAWHGATTACLILTLASGRIEAGAFRTRALATASFLFVVATTFMTGRRKSLGTILAFLLVFLYLHFKDRMQGRRKHALRGVLVLGLAASAIAASGLVDLDARQAVILDRGAQGSELWQRLAATVQGVGPVVREFGVLGAGPGRGVQGVQYFGGAGRIGEMAEAGLLRVVAELGIPGLAAVLFVVVRVARLFRRRLNAARLEGDPSYALRAGIVGLLVGNAFSAATAAQIFGDPFVYLFLGILTGVGLAPLASEVESLYPRGLDAKRASEYSRED